MNLFFKILSTSIITATVMAFTLPSTSFGTFSEPNQCDINNSTFQAGERLTYKLYYNLKFLWIPAGEVVFSVVDAGDSYEMKAIGKTYSSYESLFKVNDYFYSKVDKKTMYPQNFVRIIEEGNYRLYDSISFNQNNNIAVSYHGKTKDSARPQVHRLNNCMQDIVSNMYYMRNLDTDNMRKGDQIGINMFFDKESHPLNVIYSGNEVKDVKGLGEFETIKLIPELVAGNVFKKGDHMTMWVSNDRNKIPLLIESPVSVGSIKAVLKSHSGLKYDLTSKIND